MSCVVIVESMVMLVASSRVEVSCVVMVQYSIVVMVEVVESSGVEVS